MVEAGMVHCIRVGAFGVRSDITIVAGAVVKCGCSEFGGLSAG